MQRDPSGRFILPAIAALTVAWSCALAPAVAAPIEDVPALSAATILGAQVRGANYHIDDLVRSDGFLQIFSLVTTYGRYQVEGRDMLKVRLRELGAVTALDQMDKSKVYLDAAGKAAMQPVNLATGLVTDPSGTVEKTVSGVGALFGRIGSGVANMGKSRESAADSLLGVSSAKRQIAARLSVDPYTDFKPLAQRLDDVARVMAMGNLTISAAFSAIPGGGGMLVSTSRTTQDVAQMVLDKTASELRDANRAKLTSMGVPAGVTGAFLDNASFTPLDHTIIVAALAKMPGVANRNLFITRASQAPNRDLAFFVRRRAEMIVDYHTGVEPLADFTLVGGLPLNRTRAGKIVGIFPIDQLVWTRQASDFVAVMDRDIRARKLASAVEVRIAGTTTATAKQGLSEYGWMVFEQGAR